MNKSMDRAPKSTRRNNVTFLTRMAMITAIQLIMSFTPLGMLPLPGQYASLLTVPVAIAAMFLGVKGGTLSGLIFGLVSFWKALQTGTMIGAGVGIPSIFVLTVGTRVLMGFLTAVLFGLIHRLDKTQSVCWFAGGLLAPVLNTLLYMTVYVIILLNTPLLQSILSAELMQTLKDNVLLFVAMYVGVQAVIEAFVGCVAGGLIGNALKRIVRT